MPKIAEKVDEKQDKAAKDEPKAAEDAPTPKPTGTLKPEEMPEELGNDYHTYAEGGIVQARYVPEEGVYIIATPNEDGGYDGEFVDEEAFNADYTPISPAKVP